MVTETSLKAYYALVMSGEDNKQRHRIMRHMLAVGRPVTRHEIADSYFCVRPGPRALDEGKVIPLQSVCGRVRELLDKQVIEVVREGKCPITDNSSEFLAPVDLEKFHQKTRNLSLFDLT